MYSIASTSSRNSRAPGRRDAGTPREIAAKFAADAGQIVTSAEFREKYLTALGFEPVGDTPMQFTTFLVNDRKIGAEKVKVSGAKLD